MRTSEVFALTWEYNISVGNWPKQCTNIHEFIFEKDLGKQINLAGAKERFIEVYKNCIEVISNLIDNNTVFFYFK